MRTATDRPRPRLPALHPSGRKPSRSRCRPVPGRSRPGSCLLVPLMALLLGLLPGSASATSYLSLSLEELFSRAEVAFVGTVRSAVAEPRDGSPWTVVEFEVERWLAGDTDQSDLLSLAFLGGDLPSGELRIGLMPRFEVGETVVLLAYEEEYYSPIVGFNQGLWRVRNRALIDERGRRLGLDEQGRLSADGPQRELELLIDAVARELEARQ